MKRKLKTRKVPSVLITSRVLDIFVFADRTVIEQFYECEDFDEHKKILFSTSVGLLNKRSREVECFFAIYSEKRSLVGAQNT